MKKIFLLIIFISSQIVLAQSPSWGWVKKSTGDINEGFSCLTTDSNGNVYAGGSIISDTADFGLGTVTTNGYADYSIIKYDASGTPLWMKNGGGLGNEVVYNLVTDSSNNIYALIRFESPSVTFGSFTLNCTLGSASGTTVPLPSDIALVKYDTNGSVLWAKKIGGPERESTTAITCDNLGNVYVSAFSESNSITIGNSSISVGSNNYVGAFLSKFDSSGNTLWTKRFGNDNLYDFLNLSAPVFDIAGNLYLTGSFTSGTFTLGSITYTNLTPGSPDAFIVKLDSNGMILMQNALQGSDNDSFGNVLVIQNELFVPFNVSLFPSTTSASYSYNGSNYNTSTSQSGVMKMGSTLQLISIFNNTNLEGKIITDGTNIYSAGSFSTPTRTFGTTTLINTNSSTTLPSQDIFVTKMNTNGQFLWAKSAGGIGDEELLGFAIDPTGNLFMAGYFNSSSCTFGSTSITNTSQVGYGYVDAYVAKLNSTSLSNIDFEKDKILLFPNPTKNTVTINTNKAIKKITISDLNGRILDTQFETTVNLNNLIPGIYFLNIETENGISSRKIIKE